MNKKNV